MKIINRVYWTTSSLQELGLVVSSGCCRCQDKDGTPVHMLLASAIKIVVEKL